MKEIVLRQIEDVSAEPNHKLQLTYDDGSTIKVDFTSIVHQGGVFEPLANPEFFSQVSIGEDGCFIQWPGELDFCADALWLKGKVKVRSRSTKGD